MLIKPMFQYKDKMIYTLDENMEKFFYNTGVGKTFLTVIHVIHTCHTYIHVISYMKTMIKSIILKSQKTKMKKNEHVSEKGLVYTKRSKN